jgi:hypothetical protein
VKKQVFIYSLSAPSVDLVGPLYLLIGISTSALLTWFYKLEQISIIQFSEKSSLWGAGSFGLQGIE